MSDTVDCPRCGHEHEPGSHEDTAGDYQCSECDFEFIVAVEYTAWYEMTCKVCEFGDWNRDSGIQYNGKPRMIRWCKHCSKCELMPIEEDPDFA